MNRIQRNRGSALAVASCLALLSGCDDPATRPQEASSPTAGLTETAPAANEAADLDERLGSQDSPDVTYMSADYEEVSIAELKANSLLVVRATVFGIGSEKYNTVSGGKPLVELPDDLGQASYKDVLFDVTRIYHNTTGHQPLEWVLALGEPRFGDDTILMGIPVFEDGEDGMLFARNFDDEWEPSKVRIEAEAGEIDAVAAQVGMWCPIKEDRVYCLPGDTEMSLAELEQELGK